MKPGAKKEPNSLKVLRGSDKRYINENEPKFEAVDECPKPPTHLSAEAKKKYQEFFSMLKGVKVLKKSDMLTFDKMMEHWDIAYKASKELKKHGLITIDERKLPRKNPAAQIHRENSLAFLRYAAEFGLTPSSRAGLDLSEEVGQGDPFDSYLQGKKVKGNGKS